MLNLLALLLASSSSFQTFGRASKHSPLDSFILSWLISASFPQLSSLNDFSHSVFIAKHSHTQTQHNAAPSCSCLLSNRGFRGFWELTDYPTMHQRRRHHLQCVGNGGSRSCYDHHSLVKRFAVHFSDNQTFLIKLMIFDICVLTFTRIFGMFHLYISNRPCTNERCFWILMTLGRFEFWHALRSSPSEASVKACRVVWRLSWDKLARFRGLIICAYQHASWCKQRSEQTSKRSIPSHVTSLWWAFASSVVYCRLSVSNFLQKNLRNISQNMNVQNFRPYGVL